MLKRTQLRQFALLFVMAWLSAPACFGQKIEMMKFVVQRVGPDIKADSPDAQPRTIHRAADKYVRVEEPADSAKKQRMVLITREPESWMINLADSTATHLIDPGPTFNARLPIFWAPKPDGGAPDLDPQLVGLEFGNEEVFFRQYKARDLGTRQLDGKECKVSALKMGSWEVTLFLDAKTDRPVRIEGTKDGKPNLAYRYLSYETDLPFEPSLFEPPAGLKITEQKTSIPAVATPTPKK